MRQFILLPAWLLVPLCAGSQNPFLEGTEHLKEGNFLVADSFLTIAACNNPDANVFFNRAVARLYSADTVGCCNDLSTGANTYFDPEAEKLFNELCCLSVDTFHYSRNHMRVSKEKYNYFEIVKRLKYIDIVIGSFHSKSNNTTRLALQTNCNDHLTGINMEPSDIMAVYTESDTGRFYSYCPVPPEYDMLDMDDFTSRLQTFLKAKYGNLKRENNVEDLKVYVRLLIDRDGKISPVAVREFYPELGQGPLLEELENDILASIRMMPSFTPGRFQGNEVDYILTWSFSF